MSVLKQLSKLFNDLYDRYVFQFWKWLKEMVELIIQWLIYKDSHLYNSWMNKHFWMNQMSELFSDS